MKGDGNKYLLDVVPVKAHRAHKSSSVVMIKATASLDIPRDMRDQQLPFWSNPIDDQTLHSLGIISPSTVGTLLNLPVVCKYQG